MIFTRPFRGYAFLRRLREREAKLQADKQKRAKPTTPKSHSANIIVCSDDDGSERVSHPPSTSKKDTTKTEPERISPRKTSTATLQPRKHLIDHQANATRVSPIDSQAPQTSNKRKRPHSLGQESEDPDRTAIDDDVLHRNNERDDDYDDDEDNDDDDDDDAYRFQEDHRNIDIMQNRAKIPMPPPRKMPRVSEAPSEPLRGSRARSVRDNSFVVASRPSPTPSIRPSRPLPRGSNRNRWTIEECRQLQKLISELGPKWAMIKEVDGEEEVPKLSIRNQVNLKDKARQLVVDLLKYVKFFSSSFLPQLTYERVSLCK